MISNYLFNYLTHKLALFFHFSLRLVRDDENIFLFSFIQILLLPCSFVEQSQLEPIREGGLSMPINLSSVTDASIIKETKYDKS